MKLLTKDIEAKLVKNAKLSATGGGVELKPVVKLFAPDGNATWLITEMVDDDLLFGLCDIGTGFPEIGYVSLSELTKARGRLRLPIERDRSFKATKTLTVYANEARIAGRIVS